MLLVDIRSNRTYSVNRLIETSVFIWLGSQDVWTDTRILSYCPFQRYKCEQVHRKHRGPRQPQQADISVRWRRACVNIALRHVKQLNVFCALVD